MPVFSMFLPPVNLRLRSFRRELVGLTRERFGGSVSYGTGQWERPYWRIFDVVGLDAYREASNVWRFAAALRRTVERHHGSGRPVYVFEFGTRSYVGAAEKAAQASGVLREVDGRMEAPTALMRDEQVQADYLDELFDIFTEAGVDGTFVWGFSEPALTHSDEPGLALGIASYGIVAPLRDGVWRPKRAFDIVTRRYGGEP